MAVENFKDVDFEKLAGLPADTKPLWGKMNLQQMVEHLTDVFRVSNGSWKVQVTTPPERLEKLKKVALMSDRPFQQNFRTDIVPEEPVPTRNANMREAIEALKTEMQKFEQYYKNNPGAHESHPVFGLLNYEEWVHFHNKHFMHHFKQFGLV